MMSGFTWYTTFIVHRDFNIEIALIRSPSNSAHLCGHNVTRTPQVLYYSVQSMFVSRIDRDIAMRIDEKSILTHILEQILVVHTKPFLPGAPVYVCIIQEQHNFFYDALSFSNVIQHERRDTRTLIIVPYAKQPMAELKHLTGAIQTTYTTAFRFSDWFGGEHLFKKSG
jgi:hypothetical protein